MVPYDTLLALANMVLPSEMLSYFDIIKVETRGVNMQIHLDEKAELPNHQTSFKRESKGFLPSVSLQDFPIRDRKVTLVIRRRRWLNKETNESYCYDFELSANGTRYSKEFATFLKDILGEVTDYSPLTGGLLPH